MPPPHFVKTVGYVISCVSVLLLGAVSWKSASSDPTLRLVLIAGMATSMIGMACRWITYQLSEK
jgi:hypothetical protein